MKTTREYIIEKLCNCGFDTYVVGGFIRDILRNELSEDEDIVTAATPEEILKIFKNHKIQTIGKSYKVILVDDYEIATFRTDKYKGLSDKNVNIQITNNIYEDLERRDLTINAIAFCQYTGDLIDPYNGKDDLKNKIIKFVKNPQKRILEDPNRIIRACRFKALINGKFEEKTKEALIMFAHLIPDFVDPERINKEIIKTVSRIKKSSLFFDALSEIGALEYVFPSLNDCYAYSDHGKWHTESVIEHCYICGDHLPIRKPLLKLTGYLHDIGKPPACKWNSVTKDLSFTSHSRIGAECIKDNLKYLRFSNEAIKYITSLIEIHMKNLETPKAIRRALASLQKYNILWKDLLQLRIADNYANLKKEPFSKKEINQLVKNIMFEINRKSPNKFGDLCINGNDIMRITNLPPCHEIGIIKEKLHSIIVDNPILNKPELLEQIIRIL